MKKRSLIVMVAFVTLILVNFSTIASAKKSVVKVKGQTVFVGASHNTIDLGDNNENPIIVASRLIIRNTDPNNYLK